MNRMNREGTPATHADKGSGASRRRFVERIAKLAISLVVVVILCAVGLAAVGFFDPSPEDPVYNGVHFSECLHARDWPPKASPVAPEEYHNFQPNPAYYLADMIQRNHSVLFKLPETWPSARFPFGRRLRERQNRSEHLCSEALIALPWLGPKGEPALPALLPLLDDSDPNIRRAAGWAINAIGPRSWPVVREKMQQGSAPVRAALLSGLPQRFNKIAVPDMKHDPEACWELLVPACHDPDPDVQTAAIEALSSLRQYVGYTTPMTEQLCPAILYCLEHGQGRVRVHAAYAVYDFADKPSDVIPALERAANDPDLKLREAAQATLSRLKPELPVPAVSK